MAPASDKTFASTTKRWSAAVVQAVAILGSIVALWWTIEILDTYLFDSWLQGNGVHPRRADGLDGILWMPFLHSDFGHVLSNTFPFLLLSALIMIRGLRRWITVTAIAVGLGGFLTWAFALEGRSNHIGASGVVFAYFGALLGAAFFERRPAAFAPAIVVMMLYTTTIVVGLVPQEFVSWEGHLAGFISGIVASKVLAEKRPPRKDPDADIEKYFGTDEPWLST